MKMEMKEVSAKMTSLYHYGILGMRWGIRRQRGSDGLVGPGSREKEAQYRKKLSEIAKNKSVDEVDLRRIRYRNQALPTRAASAVATAVVTRVMMDVITGDIRNYAKMSKPQLQNKAFKIIADSGLVFAGKEVASKLTAKRYTDSGKLKSGQVGKMLTMADAVELGTVYLRVTAPFAARILQVKYKHAYAGRIMNQARFDSWGGNILPEKATNVIWQAPDLKTSIVGDLPKHIKRIN